MNASHATHRVRVWNLPTRLFHGSLAVLIVASFAMTRCCGCVPW